MKFFKACPPFFTVKKRIFAAQGPKLRPPTAVRKASPVIMKRLPIMLIALLFCALPALAQLDSVGLTPSAVTLMTDTAPAAADSLGYTTPPATQIHQVGFDFDIPAADHLFSLVGTGLLGFLVLPLLVVVAGIVLIVRALRRPRTPRHLPAGSVRTWGHAQQNSAIRTGALGVGLALMGLVMGWPLVTGTGLLVACIGVGNFWAARRDINYYTSLQEKNDPTSCDSTKTCSGSSSTKE